MVRKLLHCYIARLLNRKKQYNNITIQQSNKGFTLIELLIVIAIIGILSSFVVASLTGAQAKGRDARRKSDIDAIKKAMQLAGSDCKGGYYPGLGQSNGLVSFYEGSANLKEELETFKYLKQLPKDPRNTEPNVYKMYIKTSYDGTNVCPEPPSGTFDREGILDYRLVATLENTFDPQTAESQTQCPASGFNVTYTSASYVVCAQ